MFPGWMQIAIVVLLIILLFGRGKISDLMGDVAKGITSFRKGLKEDPETGSGTKDQEAPPKIVEHQPVTPVQETPPETVDADKETVETKKD